MPVKLRSSDGEDVTLCDEFKRQAGTFEFDFETGTEPPEVPVRAEILRIINRWAENRVEHEGSCDQTEWKRRSFHEIELWEWAFIEENKSSLMQLLEASNHLEILELLDLSCKEAALLQLPGERTERPLQVPELQNMSLPTELVHMILKEIDHHTIEELQMRGVAAVYLVRGGLRSERNKKIQKLSGHFCMFGTIKEKNECAIYLYSKGSHDFTMDKVRLILQAGERLKSRSYCTIVLSTHDRPDLVKCYGDTTTTRIEIKPEAVKSGIFGREIEADAIRAIQWWFENMEAPECNITWPDEDCVDDLSRLPPISSELKTLTINRMKNVFNHNVPRREPVNQHHWIHGVVHNLQILLN